MSQYHSGLQGEKIAETFLKRQGKRIIKRRLRAGSGEIDLLIKDGDVLVFVEVKYRPGSRLGEGLASITPKKKAHFLSAVKAYISQHPQPYRVAYLEITRAGIQYQDDILHEGVGI